MFELDVLLLPGHMWGSMGVRISLMSLSLLLQQCPACLVRLTWIVFVVGGRWPYSLCLVGCCRQDIYMCVCVCVFERDCVCMYVYPSLHTPGFMHVYVKDKKEEECLCMWMCVHVCICMHTYEMCIKSIETEAVFTMTHMNDERNFNLLHNSTLSV